MRASTTFAVVSLIAALLLSIATRATGSTNDDRVVKTSKSRAARIDLNVLFPNWCNLNPSVEHASSASVPASCEVYLMNEPSRGELFDVSTAGVEIHSNSSQYYPYTQSNRWTYAEETYVDDGSDGNDDDEHTSDKELSASVEFRSGSTYDHFSVGIFSPRGARTPNASGVIVMNVINHKPQAISSTLILRRTQPWSMADEISKNSTEYFFPRRQLLQAVDSDTTETHTTELTEISNIRIAWHAGSKEKLLPRFVNSLGDAASSIVQDGEETSAYDPIFLSINTTVTAQSLMVQYNAVDSENATSPVGTTYISVVERGSSKLPEAPLHAQQAPSDYVVDRLFGLPSVVLCKYMVGGATFSDCNFVLMGGDILAAQVSMGVITPTVWETGETQVSVYSMLALEAELSDSVETEGSFRISNYGNVSVEDYYPASPSQSSTSLPLFCAKFVVSEITENSPPDAISTNWYVKLQEIPTKKSEDISNYASLKVPLRIYSQYVTPPQIQCDSAVFTWVRRTLVVPTYCGTSSQYDDDCNRYLTEGNQIQTVAVLHGFRIAFANTERLDDFVWTKDNDAVYLVTSVDAVSINEDPAKADGGCIFHSLLLREITVGDVIHAESDLMWMPEVSGVAPYRYHGAGGYQLCKTRHSRLQLAVIVGEDIACSFTVSAPPPPPATPPKQSAYHLIQAFESRLLNSYDAERSSSAGSFVIPFTLHDVVLAQTNDVAAKASTRAFTLIPNIASQALTLGYANGVITYPQKIISQHKSIYIPSDPFPPEPPQAVKNAYAGSDDFLYAVHLRRQLAAVVTSLSSAYPSRRIAFSSKSLDSNADDEMILVDLRRDDKQGLSVTRSSVRCAPANGEPEPFKGKHELLSDLQQNFFTSFTGRDGAAFADADLLAPMPLWRIEESFEVFISSSGTVETLYFANDERSSWLVVTRHPKLMSVVSHYDSPNTAPWWTKAVAKASNGSKLPVRPTETAFVEQCAALAIQVGVADDVLQQAAGEIVGYADDVLGVAVTDGRAVSPEVLILLRIARPLSSGGNHNDGFSDSAVRSMDAPLLILCVLVCISVLLYYRRKIRRWVHRLDALSDSSEDIEEQRRVSEHRSEGILKTIKSMVATKSTAAFSRLNNGRSHQTVSHLSDDDDDEMVDVTVRAPLSVVAAAPAADESDDWDDWESAGCAPHAAVAAPVRSTEPAPLKSTAAAPPATKVHPPPPRKGNKKD